MASYDEDEELVVYEQWFEGFAQETKRAWGKRKRTARRNPSAIVAEAAVLTPQDKGDLGEWFVAQRIALLGYETAITRHSPADVWGINLVSIGSKRCVHLCLIQVKTSDDDPAVLSDTAIEEFREFADFVWDRFAQAEDVPEHMAGLPILVSYGYAGVRLTDAEPEVDVQYINRFFPKGDLTARESKEFALNFFFELG